MARSAKKTLFKGLEPRGKAGLFRFRASINGKQESVALGTADQTKATKLAKRILGFTNSMTWQEAVAKTLNKPIKKTTGEKTSIEDFIRLYEKFNLPTTNPEAISPETAETYFFHLKWIAKAADIEYIDDFDGLNFHTIVNSDGKPRSNATINNKLVSIRALFKKPMLNYLKERNINVDTPFKDAIKLKQPNQAYIPFDLKLQKKIWDECEDLPNAQTMIIKMSLGIGLRRGEIEHATPDWFQERDGTWWCHVRPVGSWSPKYGKSRSIPLMDELVDTLISLREKAADYTKDCEWLIPCGRGSVPKSRLYSDMCSVLKWLSEKGVGSGSKDPKLIHCMRKQYGSAITQNHGIYVASKYLGHASVTTTEKHYANLIDTPKGTIF